MKNVFVAAVFLSSIALAQVAVTVQLPTIRFEAPPPLVVVEPGVQVVQDYDEEVYFVDGWYWCRRDGRWFHTKDHRGGWVVAEERIVPVTIVKMTPGKYRHYKVVKVKEVKEVVKVKEHGHGHGKH
jgi:hypothetical protein